MKNEKYRIGLVILESSLLFCLVNAYINYTYNGYVFIIPDNTNDNRRSWSDASSWCKSNGTRLLEVTNADVQTSVDAFIRLVYNKGLSGWATITNAKRDGQGWNWVNGQNINNIEIEKQGSGLSKSFGFLQVTGSRLLIAASSAPDKRNFICEGTKYCAGGKLFAGRCYKSFSDSNVLSWFDARNRCLNDGGDLASFDFVLNSQGLLVLNDTWISQFNTYWIGIRRVFWKWQGSGLEVKYSKWTDGEPTYTDGSECICLRPYQWEWETCDCREPYQFICLSEKLSTSFASSALNLATTSSTRPTSTKTTTAHLLLNLSSTEQITTTMVQASTSNVTVLGIALGVGIGGGVIITGFILAVLLRKRCCQRLRHKKKQLSPPDVTLQLPSLSYYAVISQTQTPSMSATKEENENEANPRTEYALLDLVTTSQTLQKTTGAFPSDGRVTTLEPRRIENDPNHIIVNGQLYAKVMR